MPKYNILVVEDHIINQELLKEMLNRLDCSVDTAENGVVAVKQTADKSYDLIFMDLQMPEMDGFQATLEIRKREGGGKTTPIVALTASLLDSDKKKCMASGMNDYITKPFEPQDLEKVLKKFIPG